MSSCSTRGHVMLLNKKTCLLVEQQETSSCFDKRTCLLVEKGMSSYPYGHRLGGSRNQLFRVSCQGHFGLELRCVNA